MLTAAPIPRVDVQCTQKGFHSRYLSRSVRFCHTTAAGAAMSIIDSPLDRYKPGELEGAFVECRSRAAAKGPIPRSDQTIRELCAGVLPNKKRLLDRSLVFEAQIHGAQKTGKRTEDL